MTEPTPPPIRAVPVELIARSLYRELSGQLDARQIIAVATALLGEVTSHLGRARERESA